MRRPIPVAFIKRRLRKVEELGSVRRPVAEDHRVREETLLRPPRGRPAGVLVHVVAGLLPAARREADGVRAAAAPEELRPLLRGLELLRPP